MKLTWNLGFVFCDFRLGPCVHSQVSPSYRKKKMTMETNANQIREYVRSNYGTVARENSSCCGPECCGPVESDLLEKGSKMGYSEQELNKAPENSNLGLGCGNPLAIASLKAGDVVLDLGSGAGFDAFLASSEVGQDGLVIGVDMTPEMVNKARDNAGKADINNVDFRLGEIEHLPVDSASVDVIISNCVINLSPEKELVFAEAYRVLKPGGRLAISDVVTFKELDDKIKSNPELISACIAGASTKDSLYQIMEQAGFTNISIEPKSSSQELIKDWSDVTDLEELIVSANIEAFKP